MGILLILFFLCLGFVLTKFEVIKQNHIKLGSDWIIWIALPALALVKIPALVFSSELFVLVLVPGIVFLFSFIFFFGVLRHLRHDQKVVLTLLGGLGNTSFIGFPLIKYYYGSTMLGYGVILDQGTFLCLSIFAQLLLINDPSSSKLSIRALARIFRFPPFIALFIALFLSTDSIPDWLNFLLNSLTQTITPVAMVIVGYQVYHHVRFEFQFDLIMGLLYKLILAPIVVFIILYFIPISKDVFRISVFESAMAPMISASILVQQHEINPKLNGQFLGWGILLSLLTTALFAAFL